MDQDRFEFLTTTVAPYVEAMTRLMHLMAENSAAWRARPEPRGNIAECLMDRPDYSIRIFCRPKGIRPFLAVMERPWAHKVLLGRLQRDGSVHVFEYGLKVFFNFLLEEGVLDRFSEDLAQAVRRFADLAAPAEPAARKTSRCSACRQANRDTRNH